MNKQLNDILFGKYDLLCLGDAFRIFNIGDSGHKVDGQFWGFFRILAPGVDMFKLAPGVDMFTLAGCAPLHLKAGDAFLVIF